MVTIYFGFLLCDHVNQNLNTKFHKPNLGHRLTGAFRESSLGFLDCAMIFSISLQIASISQGASLLTSKRDAPTLYLLNCSLSNTLISATCVGALQCISVESRRKKFRIGIWVVFLNVFVLDLVVHFVASSRNIFSVSNEFSQAAACDVYFGSAYQDRYMVLLWYVAAPITVILLVAILSWLVVSRKPTKGNRKIAWRTCVGLGCLMLTWILLALFMTYRSSVMRVAGSSNKDMEWTFGQVISLATWVPVFVEWAYIFYCKFISICQPL